MGFFGFIDQLPDYAAKPQATARMDLRYRFLIAPHLADIAGARVLALGAHDGRWALSLLPGQNVSSRLRRVQPSSQSSPGFPTRPCAPARLGPRLIIVDSEFIVQPGPVVHLVRERADKPLNAIAQMPGQRLASKGVPSRAALVGMADALGV